MAVNAIVKFLNAARSLANQGMSKEAVINFAKNEFGEINELFKKQIDNIFKPGKGIESIKIKDEVFDDTVIKLPVDDTGKPFNPRDPLKNYSKELTDSPLDDLKKIIDDFEPMGPTKPRDKKYTGGIVDVEPSLSDIGHGSDALMARTRLVSPGNQATTSTGLNYLLAEDNDNLRVPFENGGDFKQFQKEKMMQLMQEYEQYLKNREIEKKQKPYIEKRMGTGPGPILEAAEGGRIGFANGNGVADEDAEKAALGKRVRELMDDGFDFGEAVRKAMSEGYAEGGRIGFAKGKLADAARRKFMKAAGAAGAGIAALKTGLLGFGKEAAPVAKEVIETVSETAQKVPPYFFRLVEKIKFMGDDTLASQDKAIAKKYKDYVMEEDFAGNIEIIKKGEDLQGNKLEDVYMSYKVDDVPVKGKGSTKVEEYEEFTARPDMEGKMKDVEPGVPDEVIEEAGDIDAMTLKKADGGIARMLGE